MSLLDGYEEQQNKRTSLLDGYEEQPKRTSLLDGYKPTKTTNKPVTTKVKHSKPDKSKIKYLPNGEVDTEHYKANIDEIAGIPQVELPVMGNIVNSDGNVLSGGIEKNVRYYNERFPDRKNRLSYDIEEFKNKSDKNIGDVAKLTGSALWNIPTGFLSNSAKDVVDTTKGLAQMLGQGVNKALFTPVARMVKGQAPVSEENIENIKNFTKSNINSLTSLPKIFQRDEQGRNKYRVQYRQDHPEIMAMKDALVQGLKENYGQKDIDIFSDNGINFDPVGFAQSYYAHPLNILDLVGAGEVGKLKPISQLSKGGQASNFAKTVGNKVVSPKYSENLVLNLGERMLESKPVQGIVNAIDESPMRETTDIAADFLGLNPDSRLMGSKGAAVRQAKMIEQANQVKNIAERNKAIAENNALLSGLNDVEAKNLIKSIESAEGQAYIDRLNNSIRPNIYYDDVSAKDVQNLIKQDLEDMKADKFKLQTAHNASRKGIFTQVIDNGLDMDLRQADEAYNKIIGKIKKNPELLNNENYIDSLYQELDRGINIPDETLKEEYFEKLTQAIDKGFEYNEVTNDLNLSKNFDYVAENELNNMQGLTTRAEEIRNALREKAAKNAEFYINRGMLTEETVKQNPINTYASIKYNKPIANLSDAEKLDAFKDIQKLPEEQRPFYVPIMFDNKLKASDFFANSTKRYKPSELKRRSVGMGLETNKTGGKRVYDPVELANRLDAHRIKMVNTENMINEIIDNFAKPLDLSKETVLDGYVPFNPDAFMIFYKKSIDLNKLALDKLNELSNNEVLMGAFDRLDNTGKVVIDKAFKEAIQDALTELPDDIVEILAAVKNNKIYQIPEEVAKTLGFGRNKKSALEMMFDMGTAGFKRKVLGLSPKWFINNRIGNGIMAALKGSGVLDDPAAYIKALNISDDLLPDALKTNSMYEAEKTIIGRTGGGNNSAFGNVSRLLGGEFIDTSDLKGMQKVGVQAANALGIPGKVMNTVTDAMFAFNQFFENLERKGAYLHSVDTVGRKLLKTTGQNIVKQEELLKAVLDNPQVLDEVVKNVDNTLGDYINMTPTERRVLRKVVPFYSWFRTITRYTLSLPESNPFRASISEKVSRILKEENEDLPEYQQGSTETEFTSSITGKPLRLNYEHSIPFSTFADTADNPVGLFNPLFTRPYEALTGQRVFMNKPLVSPNYENQFGGGYVSLDKMNPGVYVDKLPIGERLKAIPLDVIRSTVPGLDAVERVGIGTLMNRLNNKGLRPYDALFDTGIGGYNYDDGFYKKPKGWDNQEQLLRMFFPLQQEGQKKEIRKLPKRELR